MQVSHWVPPPANVKLSLDQRIARETEVALPGLIVVYGMTGVGKTYTIDRLHGDPALSNWDLRDTTPADSLPQILNSYERNQRSLILFVDSDAWDRFTKNLPKAKVPRALYHSVDRSDARDLALTLIDRFEEVRHIPSLSDLVRDEHVREGPKSLVNRILDSSRWSDGGKEVYLPGVTVALLSEFLQGSELHPDSLPDELKSAISRYKAELERQDADLQVLSSALLGGVAFGSAWGPVLSSVAALTPLFVGLGLVAAGATIYSFMKLRREHKSRIPIELQNWVKAVATWTPIPEWRKDLICYDVDRQLGAPLGSTRTSMERMSKDPRAALLHGVQELLGSPADLQKVKDALGIGDVEEALRDVSKTLIDLGARVTKVEQRVDNHEFRLKSVETKTGILGSARRITSATLHTVPRFARFGDRPPLVSEVHRQHIESIIEALGEGKRVAILGEAGVGKSSLLYSVCRRLAVMGKPIFTGGTSGLPVGSIWFSDDLSGDAAAGVGMLTSNPILATARPEAWSSGKSGPPRGWITVELTRHDIPRPLLERILVGELEREHVKSTPEGVSKAIEDSRGLPGFLIEKVRWCKQTGRELTPEVAIRGAPSTVALIEEIVLSIQDPSALFLLCALARSARARLHRVHLQDLLRLRDTSVGAYPHLPEEFLALVVSEPGSAFSLGHELWRDVLQEPWSSLGGTGRREPDGLLSIRSTGIVDSLLKKAFEETPPAIVILRGIESVAAVRVVAENRPELIRVILKALSTLQSAVHMTAAMEWIAGNFPDAVIEEERDLHLKSNEPSSTVAYSLLGGATGVLHGAPSYALLMLNEAERLLSPTARVDDEELRAMIEEAKGEAFSSLGQASESIACYQRAVNSWLEVCGKDSGLLMMRPMKLQNALNKLGREVLESGDLGGAVQCFLAVREIAEKALPWKSALVQHMKRSGFDGNVNPTDYLVVRDVGKTPTGAGDTPIDRETLEALSGPKQFFRDFPHADALMSRGMPQVGSITPESDSAYIGPPEEVELLAGAYRGLSRALFAADRFEEGIGFKLRAVSETEMAVSLADQILHDPARVARLQRTLFSSDYPLLLRPEEDNPEKNVHAYCAESLRKVVESLRELSRDRDELLPDLAGALDDLFDQLKEVAGEGDSAEAALVESEAIYWSLAGINNRFAAEHSRVAGKLSELQDPARAIDCLYRALASVDLLPPSSPETSLLRAQVCSQLASNFLSLGDSDQVVKWLQEAELAWVSTRDFPGGGDESDRFRERIDDLILLGTVLLFEKKQPGMAATVFANVVDLLKQRPSPDSKMQVSLVQSLDRLGSARAHVRDYEGAVNAYGQAIAAARMIPRDGQLTRDNLKPVLLEVASLTNLSAMERDLGRREEALSHLDEAGKVIMSVPQQLDPDGAMIIATLGKAYKDLSEWSQSQKWFRIALTQIEMILGGVERSGLQGNLRWLPRWCVILSDYAATFNDEDRVEKLAEVFTQAVAFLRTLRPSTEDVQINLGIVLGNRGQLLLNAGRVDEAVRDLREAESIIEPIAELNPKDQDALENVRKGLSSALAASARADQPSVSDAN